MVKINDHLPALSPEYEEAKARLESLRTEYSQLLECYATKTEFERENLTHEYMMVIGRKEYRLYTIQVEIMRYRREIALYQSALNRKEKLSQRAVAEVIKREFAEYRTRLEEQMKAVQEAEKFIAADKLSDENVKLLKSLYRELAKKLHPDLNPDLSIGARILWENVKDAYKNGCYKSLLLLKDMVDELFAEKDKAYEFPDTMTALKVQIDELVAKRDNLVKEINDLEQRPPFSYRELLKNPEKLLERRKALNEQIELFKAERDKIKVALTEIKEKMKNVR